MRGRSVIMDLYYGNICPNERDFYGPGGCQEAANAFSEHEKWFEQHLTGEAKRRFNKLIDCESTLIGTASYENFRVGLQLGVALMMEACEANDGIFRNY